MTITALITKRKRLSLNRVIGIVRTIKMGLSILLINLSTTATSIAAFQSETTIPSMIYARPKTANPVRTIFSKRSIASVLGNNRKSVRLDFIEIERLKTKRIGEI